MAEEEGVEPQVLADEPVKVKKPIVGLVIILAGVGIVLLFTVLYMLDPTSIDFLRSGLSGAVIPGTESLLGITDFIGYGVAITALVVMIMFAIKSTKPKVAPIAKYAGLIVLTFGFSVGLLGFLLGGFAGLLPDLNVWRILGLGSTWPAYSIMVATTTISAPLCFLRPKTKMVMILTLVGAFVFIFIVSTITTQAGYYGSLDIVWGIFIPCVLAGFFYRSILAIPEQERLDRDNYVLGSMKDAYRKVLVAKAIMEQRPVKIVTKIETEEGVKEEVKQEVPQGNPEALVAEAIGLYGETEQRATEYGDRYEREVAKCQVWKHRLASLMEEQKLVVAKKMPAEKYKQRWLYIF